MDILAWVERLGGWGVVLLIVKWMMRHMDRLGDELRAAVAAFTAFREEESRAHEIIRRTQIDILDEIKQIHASNGIRLVDKKTP